MTAEMTADEMQACIKELEETLAQKDQLIRSLTEQIDKKADSEYTEYKGALFQKKPGGGYREAIFCLVCKSPMTPTAARTHFDCIHCHHHAEFPGKRISDIIHDIPK